MSVWFGTPCGRILQALFGIVLLWIGMEQVTVTGLTIMMAGLIATVVAAAPPPFLVPATRRHPRQRARRAA
jgi:hypothetical protein